MGGGGVNAQAFSFLVFLDNINITICRHKKDRRSNHIHVHSVNFHTWFWPLLPFASQPKK